MAIYILNDNIALRSWTNVPDAYYIRGVDMPKYITAYVALCLDRCDGMTERKLRMPVFRNEPGQRLCN